jgi:Ser/Thr protein kinase RdoA (MazF antagonist)
VDGNELPHQLLHDASLGIRTDRIRTREGRAILVDWHGTRAILRSVPSPVGGPPGLSLLDDLRWLHAFLARLTARGFPAPEPIPAFAGCSWAIADGVLWELVSFLPGAAVRWSPLPPMEELGALLARYHATVREIEMTGQRPSALPLAEVPTVLLSARLGSAGVDPGQARVIRHLAEQLTERLRDIAPHDRERAVIHGDFTNDNVIASGSPPRATGAVDFALAHVENPLADIGYALWRSGRPHEHAISLDRSRVRRYLRGYASVAPLSVHQASIIPVYLLGRGLQMMAKRVRGKRSALGMLPQVLWLDANFRALTDLVERALH